MLFTGWLKVGDYGDSMDVLLLDDEPLAEQLEDNIACKEVTVRYWVTDKECTKDQAVESFIRMLSGDLEAEFSARYSDITGYLWTDEEINVGGHDLLSELTSHDGGYLILEVELH